jgi:hypothetical protein
VTRTEAHGTTSKFKDNLAYVNVRRGDRGDGIEEEARRSAE